MRKKVLAAVLTMAFAVVFWTAPAIANLNDVDGWLGEWVVQENGQTVTWKIDEKAAGGSAGNWYFAYGIKNPGVDDIEFVIIRMPFIGYEHQYIEMAHSNVPADFPQNMEDYTFLIPNDAYPYESFTTEPGGKYPVVSGKRSYVDNWLGQWDVVMKDGTEVEWNIFYKLILQDGDFQIALGIKNPGVDDTEFIIVSA